MNKFIVSFYDKKSKRLRWKSSVDCMIINTYLVWLGMSETCYTYYTHNENGRDTFQGLQQIESFENSVSVDFYM